MEVKIKKLHKDAVIPKYAHNGDAGMDLVAVSKEIDSDANIVYDTGLAFEIPKGYVGLVFPRSSNAKKDLLLSNSVGVLDCLVGETEIRTPTGVKLLRDIKEGDYVLSLDNSGTLTAKKVLKFMNKGVKKVYKMTFFDGSYIKCTENHEFLTSDGNYVKAKDIIIGYGKGKRKTMHLVHTTFSNHKGYIEYGITGVEVNKRGRGLHIDIANNNGIFGEIIHHIDENKTNNNISNLKGMTITEHISLHSNSMGRKEHQKSFGKRMSQHPNRIKAITSDEFKKKQKELSTGKALSEESKRKLSKIIKAKWEDVEQRQKRVDSRRKYQKEQDKLSMPTIINIVKELLKNGGIINCHRYEKYKKENNIIAPRYDKSLRIFGGHDELILSATNKVALSYEYVGEEEVFDITVEDTHNFIANDLVVHNCNYRGSVTFKFKPLMEAKDSEFLEVYEVGDRVGQIIIMPYPQIEFKEVDKLSETERGEGGYGSTGK